MALLKAACGLRSGALNTFLCPSDCGSALCAAEKAAKTKTPNTKNTRRSMIPPEVRKVSAMRRSVVRAQRQRQEELRFAPPETGRKMSMRNLWTSGVALVAPGFVVAGHECSGGTAQEVTGIFFRTAVPQESRCGCVASLCRSTAGKLRMTGAKARKLAVAGGGRGGGSRRGIRGRRRSRRGDWCGGFIRLGFS